MTPTATPTKSPSRAQQLAAFLSYFAPLAFVFVLCVADVALAQTSGYPGQQLLEFAKNNIIAPLGLFAVLAAIGSAMFKPQFVMGAVWTAVICAVMFFIIKNAPTLMGAVKG
jgi:hypothetical protein